jgi:hypothetical protein
MTPIMAQGGKILTRPTGGILATDCGSAQLYQLTPCTCDPCDLCLSTNQNTATVTASGSCGYGCDTAGGSYVPVSATSYEASCIWQYDGPLVGLPGGRWGLTIRYERGPGVWAAGVDCPPGGAYFMYYGYGITGIRCGIDGKLAGSFTIPGIGALLADCTGCTATVNLGGGSADDCNDRCPGGAPLYTATNLAAYVGKTIEIAEDPDICYAVSEYAGTPDTLITVTPSMIFDNCDDCCGDTGGTAP